MAILTNIVAAGAPESFRRRAGSFQLTILSINVRRMWRKHGALAHSNDSGPYIRLLVFKVTMFVCRFADMCFMTF